MNKLLFSTLPFQRHNITTNAPNELLHQLISNSALHKLSSLLDQRPLAEDPPVVGLSCLIPEHFVTHFGVRRGTGKDVVTILPA